MRADRSRSLTGERGGRLDRLDLWFLVVLVLATMTLRTFRLAEPYQMHFDEVYHARTATEFLQSWRYGLSHDIYEWTHPHLAKYAMALGLVLWGEDDVKATSDLGVPVVASVVEPRRIDPDVRDGRAGERLHVATGTEIRTYDLRTRALISTLPAPGVSALAIDASSLQLVVGYDDGRVATLDLSAIGPGDVAAGVAPVDLATVAGKVDLLYVTPDGASVAVGQGDHLDVVDAATGTVVGGTDLPGLVGLADGGQRLGDRGDGRRRAGPVRGGVGAGRAARRDRLGLRGPAGEPRPDGRHGLAGRQGHPRQGRGRHRRRTARGDGGPGPAAHRRRDRCGRHLRRPGHRLDDLDGRPDRRRPRPRLRVGHRGPEAVRHLGRRRRRRPITSSPSRATTPLAGRSTSGRTRCRASARASSTTRRARWSTSSATRRPRPGRSSRRRRPARTRSGRSTSSSRTGTPSSPTPASARGSSPSAWAADINADYPATDRQELLVFDGSGSMASIVAGLARLRVAPPRRHRRGDHGGLHLPAAADPLPAPARRGPGGALRAGRRDVLRPVADRHERRLRRPVHRRRLHRVRRALDGLVAGEMGVLGGDAGHRRPARPRPREQVGGALCHRRARPADPRPERARPRRGHPRADRAHLRAGLHGDHRAAGQRHREPHVPRS